MAPLANDPIMSGRLIRLFRHLQCQNPSIISDFIGINVGCKICDGTRNTEHGRNNSGIILDEERGIYNVDKEEIFENKELRK